MKKRKSNLKKNSNIGRSHLPGPFRKKSSKVFTFNPASEDSAREEATKVTYFLFDYDKNSFSKKAFDNVQSLLAAYSNSKFSWIRVTGLRTQDIKTLCAHFKIHQLTIEDILSTGQRAKMDELNNSIFCLLPTFKQNTEVNTITETNEIEKQQISLLLSENTVLSFQEDNNMHLFDQVEQKLQTSQSKIRERSPDFLFYSLIDTIVDDYFTVIEKTGLQIEDMEERIIQLPNSSTLVYLNRYRQNVSLLRRTILPIRDIVNGILKSENPLIKDKSRQYYKDVYDHALQANEIIDSYRDLLLNLQGLYINQVGLKMNEIMKVLAIVTALFTPLTLIAGIYGMNFDHMPELHTKYGYYLTLIVMALLFFTMLFIFKKRKWF